MTIYRLDHRNIFPSPHEAEPDGLLAVGGDLSPARLELAYRSGIFPWYTADLPILWYSPDPRMILTPATLRINRSLRKAMAKRPYRISLDQAFSQVMFHCASTPRPRQRGTWITQDMRDAYNQMHLLGLAHSVEAWDGESLVGGAYGMCLGGCFCGESMFAHAPNASKIAFSTLVHQLHRWDIELIDCQVHTDYLDQMGGHEIPRYVFLQLLQQALRKPTRKGVWQLDADLQQGPVSCELG